TVRNRVLSDVQYERQQNDKLKANHLHPAISKIQKRHKERTAVKSVDQYGIPNSSTEVSIIIPLYRRIDFLEQQLSQFVHDREIREADLIYVLDSPELADGLRHFAAQLSALYQVPFRIVTLERNAGYSIANNVGASFAYGRLLLLLNSDILPSESGWLKSMTAFYDSVPRIGALGAKECTEGYRRQM
ncbi:MAG: glycosyltransferase, partial [Acidobacteriota bacterium]|nr:glycosyltransferase [Acidobacteriota bacterium]